jgi:hypothetical protein
MSVHRHIAATGYLDGSGVDSEKLIRSIMVIPKGTAGSWKIEGGTIGAAADLIPNGNSVVYTVANGSAHVYPLKQPFHYSGKVYITVANCELLIEHG